jgi:cell division protein WhiA
MTFTTRIKEEVSKLPFDLISGRNELLSFVRYDGKYTKDKITLVMENASVARRIYKIIKEIYHTNISVIVRNQRRFRVKQIYILEIKENILNILEDLSIYKDGKKIDPQDYLLETKEDKIAFIQGLFLACGSINDPATSGYHLEFVVPLKKDAIYIQKVLKDLNLSSKILKRSNHYMIYLKNAEQISDLIKMFNAINSLFYFEDIRIYRDHKNMVNRLNNCEIANQEKTIKAGMNQIDNIKYIEDKELIDLLDERTKDVMKYRKKYPEVSFNELAEIISMETGNKIGKSGINHCFIKIRELVKKHQER